MLRDRLLQYARGGSGRIVVPGPDPVPIAGSGADKTFIEIYNPEHHTYFEAMWLVSGQAQLKVNERVYAASAGDIIILPPLYSHADVYDRETPAYESVWFSYGPDSLSFNFFNYIPFGQSLMGWNGYISGSPEIVTAFSALHREALRQDAYSQDAMHALLLQLVVSLLRAAEAEMERGAAHAPGRVAPLVLRYLREHYAGEVSLGGIARLLKFSPNYLATIYKRETGQTIFDALTSIRMEHAVRLLLEERQPVHAVAKAVGYHSAEHFSRVFHHVKGSPPSQYGKTKL